MFGNWELQKKGEFGWYVERREVRGFWLERAGFDDPGATTMGAVDAATAAALLLQVQAHSTDIHVDVDLQSAIRSGALRAFKIAEDLGGGYMIVVAAGGSSALAAMSPQVVGRERSWISKLFGSSSGRPTRESTSDQKVQPHQDGKSTPVEDREVQEWVKANIPVGVEEMLAEALKNTSQPSKALLQDAADSTRDLLARGLDDAAPIIARCLLSGAGYGHTLDVADSDGARVLHVSVCPFEWQQGHEMLRKEFPGKSPKSVYRAWFDSLAASKSFKSYPRQLHLIFYCRAGRVVPRMGAVYFLPALPALAVKGCEWFECFPYEFNSD
jgi:hypothetical protein